MSAKSDIDETWAQHQGWKLKKDLQSRLRRDQRDGTLSILSERFLQQTHGGVSGYEQLVDLLCIGEFSALKPTLAHRFIVYLARENALAEVVTTNYDCALERAWAQSLGLDYPSADAAVPGLQVIWNLETYRRNGVRAVIANSSRGSPAGLRIHKINGCAHALNNRELEPRHILLTERQLQRWRERAWARDMFRDRLRTSTVLLTGFGSAEPQVQHTVGLVQEEWSRSGDEGTKTDCAPLLAQPNPLMVAGFGESDPSDSQWQALVAFRDAHDPSHCHDILDLYIGPRDKEDFQYVKPLIDNELAADAFWQEIYARVASRRLRGYLDTRSSPVALELSEVSGIRTLLAELRNRLWRIDGTPTDVGIALWMWPAQLRQESPSSPLPPVIAALSALILRQRVRRTRYESIAEHGGLLVRLLLVAMALEIPIDKLGSAESHSPDGIAISIGQATSLIVARAGAHDSVDRTEGWRLPPGIQSQLVLEGTDWQPAWRTTRGAQCRPIFFEDILRDSGATIRDLGQLGLLLRHHLLHPTNAARRHQPSLTRPGLRERR